MKAPVWLLAAPLLALAVVASGVIRLQASAGHWAVTDQFLRFASRRSIATWSAGIAVPPLTDPALAQRGAGHYALGCRPCHGAPDLPPPPYARVLVPPPPALADHASHWDPEDLFYVVKHGTKFTAMPPWPVRSRDDEVWSLVAFLRVLPTLDRAAYREMAYGEDEFEGMAVAARPCAGCHGQDGLGRGAVPRIAGQQEAYLSASLEAYASGARPSGIMLTAVSGRSSNELAASARHFAALPSGRAWPATGDRARGERLARGEVVGVPGCVPCHGPGDQPRNPTFPLLAAQDPDWLALQLRLFQAGGRGGTPFAGLMEAVLAHGLSEADVRDVSAWYAGLDGG